MSWRPDNWNTDKLVDEFDETNPATEFDYFEAGADAMLEALKEYALGAVDRVGHLKVGFRGIILVIPDEGKK